MVEWRDMKSLLIKLGKPVKVVVWALFGLVVLYVGLWVYGVWHDDWSGYTGSQTFSDGTCNVAVIPITGELTTQPVPEGSSATYTNGDDILRKLRQAESESEIKAVLVRIDSSGGTPVAAEMISDALGRLSKPSAGLIREYGTSGAYLIATGASTIIASPFSDIGGIGVTMSYVENPNAGQGFIQLSAGKFKDAGNPNKPLTWEERALFERDVQIIHEGLIQKIAENRKLSVSEVTKLADGSSMLGGMALKNKLIDELGDQETSREWFANELKLSREEVIFCE